MRPFLIALGTGSLLLLSRAASAKIIPVGAGQALATPCDAVMVASAGDEIDVSPGTYTDSCEINVANLTIIGVGGMPKIDLSATNHPADYKGIFVISADNVHIENLELTGAHIDDSEGGNAAALRVTGKGDVIHGCFIHDNQNGVLAAPTTDGGTITIEYTELSHNGLGDGCDQPTLGCTHNVYISKTSSTIRYDKTVFQFNWSHNLATDFKDKGHLFKSRSRESDVLYNRITGESGGDSVEVELPNGGVGIIVGNIIEKGKNADNPALLAYGAEGLDNPVNDLYVVSNTFVNDFGSGTFINLLAQGTLTAHDNILFGAGTPSSTGILSRDNLSGVDPLFVNAAAFDYHLQAGSAARGNAVDPGTGNGEPLTPGFEYVQPLAGVPRLTAHDLGAFEYGTSLADAGVVNPDGGDAVNIDAGTTTSGPGTNGPNGAGVGPPITPSSGCACDTTGASSRFDFGALVAACVALASALYIRSRRAHRASGERSP